MNNSDLELERFKFSYEEELARRESKNRIVKKLMERKISESNLQNQRKLIDLGKAERAMLNLLEDSKELEERLSVVISSMGEGLIVIDKDYKIVLINETAKKNLEVSGGEAIGQDIRKIAPVVKGSQKISDEELPVSKMFRTEEIVTVKLEDDLYYHLPSGKKFPIALVDAPLKGDGITGAVIVFRNVSEEKKLEEARANFISVASHQLRTPLTAVRWYAEMLQAGDAGPLNEKQKDLLQEIYRSALRLADTLNMLLALARLESGRLTSAPMKLNLVKFSKEILKRLEPSIKPKNLKITIISDKNLPLFQFDILMLDQVINNLLANAVQYAGSGGQIEIEIKQRKNEIIYSVKDDGIGIPQNQQSRLFERFFRAENAIKKVPDGTGLGLYLVKNLVELWKGKVGFESPAEWNNKKKGAMFYFTIPTTQ